MILLSLVVLLFISGCQAVFQKMFDGKTKNEIRTELNIMGAIRSCIYENILLFS